MVSQKGQASLRDVSLPFGGFKESGQAEPGRKGVALHVFAGKMLAGTVVIAFYGAKRDESRKTQSDRTREALFAVGKAAVEICEAGQSGHGAAQGFENFRPCLRRL